MFYTIQSAGMNRILNRIQGKVVMKTKRISVMDTSFRDGFQSCLGARVFTKDYLPALEAAKEAGITHFETAGGALFQSMAFYNNENPFDNMDAVRATVGPDINLQSLARGVNVVGLVSQSSDIIDLHARMFAKHGITTIRNFDALNDVENLIFSGHCIKNAGLRHEIVVTMMALSSGCGCTDAHTPAFYMKTLRAILDSGVPFDSVAFKDASGTATPNTVYETIKAARALLGHDIPIRFHSHETAGISVLAYKAALDGGADGIDLAMAPLSGGTCQPDHITMWHALKDTPYDLGYDIDKLLVAESVLKDCLSTYFMPPEAYMVNPEIVFSPVPGGALTANTQMLRDNGILDKYPQIVMAMREVVEKGGYGTSVTPVSQFYFQQAFNNVMFGDWKKIADGYGKMVLGYFGKTPCSPDSEIMRIATEQLGKEPTTRNPREINDENPKLGIAVATKALEEANLPVTEENIMIAATCESKGILFLQGKAQAMVRKIEPANELSNEQPKTQSAEKTASSPADNYVVQVEGKRFVVQFDGGTAMVNGRRYDVNVQAQHAESASVSQLTTNSERTEIKAALPGNVLKVLVAPKSRVAEGDTLFVLESMKMEIDIKASVAGTLDTLNIEVGHQVQVGQVLATIVA